jgi:hypothetical protein
MPRDNKIFIYYNMIQPFKIKIVKLFTAWNLAIVWNAAEDKHRNDFYSMAIKIIMHTVKSFYFEFLLLSSTFGHSG